MTHVHATAGHSAHAAASRLRAACGVTAYPWQIVTTILPTNGFEMAVFDSKPTRRLKEPSP